MRLSWMMAIAALVRAAGWSDSASDDADPTDETCEGELSFCDERCVDTWTDPEHCGACDQACAAEEACVDGSCVFSCGEGLENCDGECVDLDADLRNCGGC